MGDKSGFETKEKVVILSESHDGGSLIPQAHILPPPLDILVLQPQQLQ